MAKGQANAHLYRFATSNELLYHFLYGMLFRPLSPQLVTTQQLLSLSPLSHAPSRRLLNAEETWTFNSTCALLFVLFSSPDLERLTLTETKPFSIVAVRGNQTPLRLWAAVVSRDSLECVTILRRGIMPSSAFWPFTWCVWISGHSLDSQRSCCSTLEKQVPVPQQMTKRRTYCLPPPRKYSDYV